MPISMPMSLTVTEFGEQARDASGFVLRSPEPGDDERLYACAVDPTTIAYAVPAFVPRPESPADVRRSITATRSAQRAGEPSMFVVAASHDPDRLLGSVSWRFAGDPRLAVVALGYDTHPDCRGRGVASAGVGMITRTLFESGAARVEIAHSVENPTSCRVAERAGYVIEGRRRGFLPLRDPATGVVRRHDLCEHGILADDLRTAG